MSEADKINSGYLTDVHGSLTIDTGAPPEGGFRITASSYVPDPIFIITSEGRWMRNGVDITDDAAALREAFTHYLNHTIHSFMAPR